MNFEQIKPLLAPLFPKEKLFALWTNHIQPVLFGVVEGTAKCIMAKQGILCSCLGHGLMIVGGAAAIIVTTYGIYKLSTKCISFLRNHFQNDKNAKDLSSMSSEELEKMSSNLQKLKSELDEREQKLNERQRSLDEKEKNMNEFIEQEVQRRLTEEVKKILNKKLIDLDNESDRINEQFKLAFKNATSNDQKDDLVNKLLEDRNRINYQKIAIQDLFNEHNHIQLLPESSSVGIRQRSSVAL